MGIIKRVLKRVAAFCIDILMVVEGAIELILKTLVFIRYCYVKGVAWIVSIVKPEREDLQYFDTRINDMAEDDTKDVNDLIGLRDKVRILLSKKSKEKKTKKKAVEA